MTTLASFPAYNAYLDGPQVPGDGYQFVLDVSRPDDQWRELFLPSLVRTVRYRRGVDDPLACRSAKPCAYEPRRLAERLEARVDCYAKHGLAYDDKDASRVLRELWHQPEESCVQAPAIVVEPVHTINVHPKLRRLHMARRKSVSATPKAEKTVRKQATPAVTKPVKTAATKSDGAKRGPKGPRVRDTDSQKIKILTKENPKRAGSAAAVRFDKYQPGMTVSDALAAGLSRTDLAWDQSRGYIQVGG